MSRARSLVREAGERPVVVDASIAVKWFAPESDSELADRLIAGERILVAPDIMPVEAAHAWWKKVRRGEMAKADLEQAVANLLAMGLEWVPVTALVERAAALAAVTGHTVYDCTYLVACAERSAWIATADEKMRGMAERMRLKVWRPAERG